MPKQAVQKVQQQAQPKVQPKIINVERMDVSTFDESFSFLKDKFNAEMKRMDDEMNVFTNALKNLYGTGSSKGPADTEEDQSPETSVNWESLADSPLIHGEGADKLLRLQFDLSAFDPAEIKVEYNGDSLIVSAQHEEVSEGTSVHRDFRREFLLPHNIDPETIVSSISRDGVLIVQVPLSAALAAANADDTVLSKQVSKKNRPKPSTDPRIAPGAPPGNLIPQSPMSSASPASPEKTPPSKVSTQILQSQDTSKQSSKIKPQRQPK